MAEKEYIFPGLENGQFQLSDFWQRQRVMKAWLTICEV